jgi:hypothetical protein
VRIRCLVIVLCCLLRDRNRQDECFLYAATVCLSPGVASVK